MGNDQARLLLIGLDNSGKTTILSKLMNPGYTDKSITPTIGYAKKQFERNGITFEVLDMAGQSKYRGLWITNATQSSQAKINGIIFVVDGTDKMRLNVSREQLDIVLTNASIDSSLPLLIYANKMDRKEFISKTQIAEILQLKDIKRENKIFECSGISGKGIQQGISWLSEKVKQKIK